VNPGLHPDELRRTAEIAEPHAVVCVPSLVEHLPYPLITPESLRVAGNAPAPFACAADTPAFALFTSGTTSDPRICQHTHADPRIFDEAAGSVIGITRNDVSFSVSPMFFAYGLGNSLFFPLFGGGVTVLSPARATEADALDLIRRHHVTVFYAQPSFYA